MFTRSAYPTPEAAEASARLERERRGPDDTRYVAVLRDRWKEPLGFRVVVSASEPKIEALPTGVYLMLVLPPACAVAYGQVPLEGWEALR